MNSKRRPGYGTFTITQESARRVQRAWLAVEPPALTPWRAQLLPFRSPADETPPDRRPSRPMAA